MLTIILNNPVLLGQSNGGGWDRLGM